MGNINIIHDKYKYSRFNTITMYQSQFQTLHMFQPVWSSEQHRKKGMIAPSLQVRELEHRAVR